MTHMTAPRPMKPTKLRLDADLDSIKYPLIAQPKLNGLRCTVHDGRCYSNSGKTFPSSFVSRFASLEGCDGELIVGNPTDNDVLRRTVSAVMTAGSTKPVDYYVFDSVARSQSFYIRYREAASMVERSNDQHVHIVENVLCSCREDVLSYESTLLSQGHEGVILRDPVSPYKHGRSTVCEGYLLALKRREFGVATIVAANEKMENYNPSFTNDQGYAHRSHCIDGRYPCGVLGSFTVKDCSELYNGSKLYSGIEFNVGTGFTDEDRADLWAIRNKLILTSARISYTYFGVGVFNKPLHAAYRGMR